jgi:hypothetical protein
MTLTTTWRLGLLVITTLTAGACITPTGPASLVLPGEGKTHDQFRADDARCRPVAAAEVQASSGGYVNAQSRYDMAYIQCMYSAGHQVPVRGGPMQTRETPGAPPAGTPAPPSGTPPPAPPTR